MAAKNEMICSEVHTFVARNPSSNISEFRFSNPLRRQSNVSDPTPCIQDLEYDSDGDVIVTRSNQSSEDIIRIEHDLSTSLAGVGRQVWRGSLLLADYLIHNHEQVEGKEMLEIGSGTGLTSIVAVMCGARVTATDIPTENILTKIQTNIDLNKSLLPQSANIQVKALDVTTDKCGDDCDIIFAGDVIYDDNITDAFVSFIQQTLTGHKNARFLVSLEKRYVFTVKDLETVAPAFDHFMDKLEPLLDELIVEFLELDFDQYFCYDRSDDMVLMEIKSR